MKGYLFIILKKSLSSSIIFNYIWFRKNNIQWSFSICMIIFIQAIELLINHNDLNASNNVKIYTIISFPRFSPIIDSMRGKVARWQCFDATVCGTNQYHHWHHGNKLYHHLSNVRWEQIVRMLTDMLILLIHFCQTYDYIIHIPVIWSKFS